MNSSIWNARFLGAFLLVLLILSSVKGGRLFGVSSVSIRREVDTTILPRMEFKETSLADAVRAIVAKAKMLDPAGTGISLIGFDLNKSQARISADFRNERFIDVLTRVADAAGYEVRVDRFATVIFPKGHRAIPEVVREKDAEAVDLALPWPVSLTLENAAMQEAIDTLQRTVAKEPRAKEAKIIFRPSAREAAASNRQQITVYASNVPAIELFRHFCEHTMCYIRISKDAVIIDARK